MTLENVIDEIISQAERKKMEIIDQAKQESKKILDEAIKKSKEREWQLNEATEKMVEETKKMEISTMNIQSHKMFLDAKKTILDDAMNQLTEKINKLETPKRKELLRKLMEKARKELPNAKFVYSNEGDKELVSGVKGLKFNGTIDCVGGVIVENEDKTIRVNYTFDVILKNVREAYLNEVAKRLFEKEK